MTLNNLIQIFAEEISKCSYGETLNHEYIADKLNLDEDTSVYRSAILKLKSQCLEKGKMLISVKGIGYQIINPDNYSKQCISEFKRAGRRIKQAEKILKFAPINDMSNEGKRIYQNVYDRTLSLNAHMKGAVVELQLLENKK